LEIARTFLDNNSALFGLGETRALDVVRAERVGDKWYVTLAQTIEGARVRWGGVDLRIWSDGRLYSVRSRLLDESLLKGSWSLPERYASDRALQRLGEMATGARVTGIERVWLPAGDPVCAYEVRIRRADPPLDWTAFVDGESGEVIFGCSNIRHFSDSGQPFDGLGIECVIRLHQLPQFYDQLPVCAPSRWERISVDGFGDFFTDPEGYVAVDANYPLEADVSTTLSGRYLRVINAAGLSAFIEAATDSRGVTRLSWNNEGARPDEMNCYFHGNWMHDFVKDTLGYDGMDFRMPCTAGLVGYQNAYWDGSGMAFGGGGSRYRNFALFSDVIYHEYTHGVNDHIYRPYGLPYIGESGAIDEALSDYFAATITNDPEIGNGGLVISSGQSLRNMDNSLVWPDDGVGEVHADGEILGGALWDLRDYVGRVAADSLIHLARYDWPQNFEEFFYSVLLSDDNNGNLADGTPHDAAIFVAFGDHGFAPNPDEQVVINHTELHDSEDTLATHLIVAEIISVVGIDTSAVFAAYSTGGGFTFVDMVRTARPNEYIAYVPPQRIGTHVSYYLSVGLKDVPIFYTDPPNAPDELYGFDVLVDTIPPLIQHEPVANLPYDYWPLSVLAEVTDNLGVGSVLVEYAAGSDVDTVEAISISGSDFSAILSGEVSLGDTLEYRIVAFDNSRSRNSATLPETGWFRTSFGLGFFEDVEGDVSSWTHSALTEGYTDPWIVSTALNHTTSGISSWLCLGTDPSGRSLKVDGGLVAPKFHLGEGSWLSFWHRISADAQNDFVAWNGAVIEISRDDGDSWEAIEPLGGYPYELLNDLNPLHGVEGCFSGDSEGWERVEFDLSEYLGDALIRFRLALDGYGEGEMWAIDDINLYAGDPVGLRGIDQDSSEGGRGIVQAYPNPFNPTVTIRFGLPATAECRIDVYDIRGRLVRRLLNGEVHAGTGTVSWNALDETGNPVASGVYFVRLSSGDWHGVRKILLLR
jgi:hypothetical protein